MCVRVRACACVRVRVCMHVCACVCMCVHACEVGLWGWRRVELYPLVLLCGAPALVAVVAADS